LDGRRRGVGIRLPVRAGATVNLPAIPEMKIIRHRDLSVNEATAITDRIKSKMADMITLVAKAHIGRVWIALGYESWADYIKGEFDHAPLSLPRDERRAVVSLLRGQGMSTRAIGSATGVHKDTVINDLATGENSPVDGDIVQVTGLDGRNRNYSVTCQPTPEAVQPAPSQTVTCPTCGGTGRITQ
jgi:hypothetical protein